MLISILSKRHRRVRFKNKSFHLDDAEEAKERVTPLPISQDNSTIKKKVTLLNYLESIKEEESRSREDESHIHSMQKKRGEMDTSSLETSKL